ncbi:MAG: DUF932 domain-containing protein [Akkermansiaceae bacterium]|nr:DUF932 domain-containing protein [Akkermansiaceae bacterium]
MNNVIQLQQQPVTPASTARGIPFEIVENPPGLNTETRPKGLLLHCGAQVVDRADLFGVLTPGGTDTWYPIPHRSLLTEVEHQLRETGFVVRGETHALTHDGARYFGVIEVSLPTRGEQDFSWVVGLRNSHDKSLPAGLVAGTQVFVCDNLCFNGEVKLSRKHTRHVMRDLRQLTARAVGKLGDKFRDLDRRVGAYKRHYLPDRSAHDLVIRAVDCRAITPSQVPAVLSEWRNPRHKEFLPRNGWSLFNAFTEVYKTVNPQTAVKRGQALHGLFDTQVALAG